MHVRWSAGPTSEREVAAAAAGCRGGRSTARASAIGSLLALACEAQEPPHLGTLRYESESFEIWVSDGLDACGGTYAYTEDWLAAFRERVGDHGNPARHTFHWLTPEDFDHGLCPTGIACAYPVRNVVYSTVIPFEHEIVHAELDAQPPSVLREGVAEAFGSIDSPFQTTTMSLDPLLDDEQIPGIGYQTAGRFTRFVIERHGLDAYFALFEALDGASGREPLEHAVEDVLGVELKVLEREFERSAACSVDRWRYYDHECSTLPLTPWESPTRWAVEVELSCDADDAIGPRRGLVWTQRALEVAHEGRYELVIASADETAEVVFSSCDAHCYDGEPKPAAPAARVATGGRESVYFTAGRHWLQVQHAEGSDARVSIGIER